MMKNLIHLAFYDASYLDIIRFTTDLPSSKFSSSTLLTLNIKAYNFNDCLCILDGRFNNLQSLVIDLMVISHLFEQVDNQRNIPNLKYFNLSCFSKTWEYKSLVVPLIRRMSNLEKLGLYITASCVGFIDGNSLKEDILHHLTKVKYFDFDIYSLIFIKNNQMNFSSKEDVQQTFTDFSCEKVISCLDYFPHKRKIIQCHVYSYPFQMKSYENITNHFPGGYYRYVRIVSLHDDERPFEHEFFRQISLAFPLMTRLTVINYRAQNSKQSIDMNENFEIIQYYHLIELDIRECHDDYTEQFLNTKTYLHNMISIIIDTHSLARITQNFTRDETRINCGKVNEIFFYGETSNYSIQSLRNYFPFADID
ncbi:hypothetical protein I4U23_016559 [Adineta vaga]|nr:hypothetical protein I4U23_016559 [Adineta vaga]